ncbi:hypothetical protein [Mucilaginibacter flavus]|uniref:hypothetical protein n=1 Tax=Mucilaginibacter flavus TaxID=931504 RepID=UPI0025B57C0C|nr:hypothetical protein [Mucilaginibacter flavus]MDN3580644.1 hypothetical protein [Mucilaginibacter flavus]
MKSKIFNPFLLALTVLLTLGLAGSAQQKKPAKPVKPAAPVVADADSDDDEGDYAATGTKEYQEKMNELKAKMHDLQAKMNSLNKQHFNKAMKGQMKTLGKTFKHFDNNFSYNFDSLKTFSYRFNDSMVNFAFKLDKLAPMIAYGFKDFDNSFNFSYDTDNGDGDSNAKSQDVVEKTKTYSKTYSVDANDVINIDNKFGKITVNTWAKNEVKVDVAIKVGTNNGDKAQKMLDNVVIRDSKDGNGVYFKTEISSGDNNGSWSNIFGGGSSNSTRNIEINYTVYMPAKNPLTISNKYGATDLPDLGGKLIITNSFGSLAAKVLSNPGNQIKVKYGNANIGSLNGSDLDVAFGSLDLGDCDKLNAKLSYSSAKIGKIKTSGNINVKFGGGVSIAELDRNMKNLAVNSSYSSIKLGMADEPNADFDVTVKYGSFNYGDHPVNITNKTPGDNERGYNPTKTYKGHIGKTGADKIITINSSFGSVKFD